MRYYAVKKGRKPGIYESWAECREQIHKFSGAVFKSFESVTDAELFLEETQQEHRPDLPFAYIDGSYSKGVYGYGGFISHNGEIHIIQGTGNNPEYAMERNIAGEAIGLLQIVSMACSLGIQELNIYYDYAGLEQWATGGWKAKSPVATYYRETILNTGITIHFIKVQGHTGIEGNEIADCLAKEAVGAKLRKKDVAMLQEFKNSN